MKYETLWNSHYYETYNNNCKYNGVKGGELSMEKATFERQQLERIKLIMKEKSLNQNMFSEKMLWSEWKVSKVMKLELALTLKDIDDIISIFKVPLETFTESKFDFYTIRNIRFLK